MAAETARAQGLLDLLDTAVVHMDGSGRILQMNSSAEHCLLVSRARARGHRLEEVVAIPPELREVLEQLAAASHGVRLHELKMEDSTYDCTVQRTDEGDVLLEFHNLEWERLRLRLNELTVLNRIGQTPG